MRNQLVCWLSRGPLLVPTEYLMYSFPDAPVLSSGSVPSRPTSVMRASCDGREVEKARATMEAGDAMRRVDWRKDILVCMGGGGVDGEGEVYW